MAQKSRGFCFTYWHESAADIEMLQHWGRENCKYIMFGEEVCPTTGRAHCQGWMYFKNERSFKALCKVFAGKWHIEVKYGSEEQNEKYCRKDGKVWEFGDMPKQGARTDLYLIRDRITNGESVDAICMENPIAFHQYGRTMRTIEDIAMRKLFRTEMTTCDWIHGPTATDKSRRVFENYHPDTHYVWKNDCGWQDDYCQQEFVIINDFRGELPYNELLQMIDRYPWFVRRRNRPPMPFISKHVYITSSLPPEKVYNRRDAEDHIAQLLRRIKVINTAPCVTPAGAEVAGGNTRPQPDVDEGKRLKANFEAALLELEQFIAR